MTEQEEIKVKQDKILNLVKIWAVIKHPFESQDAEGLLCLLSQEGVVIKVSEISEDLAQTASESPKYLARGKDRALISTERTSHIFKDFKDMGYVAVKPLIERGNAKNK